MAFKLQQLIDRFSLTHKILDYLKGKGFNLQTCAIALNQLFHVVIWPCGSHLILGVHYLKLVDKMEK
jgi:hypothetical protein